MLEDLFPTIEWLGEDDNDYQGEWVCVGRDRNTGQFYYKHGYYGSCSGCDQLEAVGPNDPDLIADMKRITPIPISVLKYVRNEADLVLPAVYNQMASSLAHQLVEKYGHETLDGNVLIAGVPEITDPFVQQYEESDHLTVWNRRYTPEEVMRYVNDDSDIDWVAVVPPRYSECYIAFLDNEAFGCCSVRTYQMGRCTIYVGRHS
jgi:hypothetical protein